MFNVTTYGANGNDASDDRASFASADAAGAHKLVPAGTYLINSALTLTGTWEFEDGAKLKPASGVTITLNCDVVAGNWQIFDLSASNSAADFDRRSGVGQINACWFGAKGDGASATGTISAGDSTLTISGGTFASTDVGKVIVVPEAGTATMKTVGSYDNSTEIITITSHGFTTGQPVRYVANAGSVGGLSDGTIYYANVLTANTLKLYTTLGHAMIGHASTGLVNLTGSLSGSTAALGVPTSLSTTIASINHSTSVELTAAATFGVTGKRVTWGTDNSTALLKAIQSSCRPYATYSFSESNKSVYFPAGMYCFATPITGLDQQFGLNLTGDGRYQTIFAYVGASGSVAINLSSFSYARGGGFGLDCNSTAKGGLYLKDDQGAVLGGSIHVNIEDVFIRDCIDPTGWTLFIGPPDPLIYQVSECKFEDIYAEGCTNGAMFRGQQTISIELNTFTCGLMQGGVGLNIEDCRNIKVDGLRLGGKTSTTIRVAAVGNGSAGNAIKNFYLEAGEQAHSKAIDVTVPSNQLYPLMLSLENGDISWQGTDSAAEIVRLGAGITYVNNVLVRAASGASSFGKIVLKHYAEGSGGRATVIGSIDTASWTTGNLVWEFGQSDYRMQTNGRMYASSRETIVNADSHTFNAIRTSSFGNNSRRASYAWWTLDPRVSGNFLEGYMEPIAGGAFGEIGCFGTDGTEVMRWGGFAPAAASKVQVTGASGASGYQHPLYLGTYAFWVDSLNNLRFKSGAPGSDGDGGIVTNTALVAAPTYGTTVTPNLNAGRFQAITVTNGTAFAIGAPTNPSTGQTLTLDILNSSGGAMGAITWNAVFKMAGAFTNPANTKRRTITFFYNGSNWIEESRAVADIG